MHVLKFLCLPPAPVVNIKEQEVKTSVGQPTTLYIEARDNPPPEISWTKNGLPVNNPLLQNGSLYIHSTTHSDQGTYTVTATSDEGSTGETIKLLVLNPQYVPCKSVVCVVCNVLLSSCNEQAN